MLNPKKKKWLIALGIIGASSYGAYRVYNSPSIVRKRKRFVKLLGALLSVGEMVSESAEAFSVISRDLKEFLLSDSDEIPNSLKQLSKIARSDELSQSLGRVSECVTTGVLRGYKLQKKESGIEEVGKSSSFSDKLMDKLISGSGTAFVSVVVGSFAKNLVMEVMEVCSNSQSHSSNSPGWVDLLCDDRLKVIIANITQTFVSTAVAVYLDKTMHINFYDDLFSGMTNPMHRSEVRDIMVSLCNGAVETLVKTSHQALANNKVTEQESSTSGKVKGRSKPVIDLGSNGWLSSVSSTLAVPRNRRFVLDVSGRVTFGAVRSVVEFMMWKMMECLKASVNTVQEDIRAKSSVILTICMALILHVFGSTHYSPLHAQN
ncbi:hypothetical protein DM860_013188 [Cuscuta australis]|uniref:Protein PHLOEM PROTEIN 2-LIKE A10 n=1 Tax=Cuscuta australis TaxID=267555 RepID=A0A328DT57_9ASTE|nr:hypothetical protein DM860_013188 [Cuscuta australis]